MCIVALIFAKGSHSVSQAGLELTMYPNWSQIHVLYPTCNARISSVTHYDEFRTCLRGGGCKFKYRNKAAAIELEKREEPGFCPAHNPGTWGLRQGHCEFTISLALWRLSL